MAWENVEVRSTHDETLRLEVPGGWIYLYKEYGYTEGSQTQVTMTFVPRPPPIDPDIATLVKGMTADELRAAILGRKA